MSKGVAHIHPFDFDEGQGSSIVAEFPHFLTNAVFIKNPH